MGLSLPRLGLQAAGQQQLFDQGIEFTQVVFDFLPQSQAHGIVVSGRRRGFLQQAQGHLQARQWRAQFMRSVGHQARMRLHEGLDAVGRTVESGSQLRHLVLASVVDTVPQRTRAEALHSPLQGFQASCQSAHHGVSTQGHRQEQGRQHRHQATAGAHRVEPDAGHADIGYLRRHTALTARTRATHQP